MPRCGGTPWAELAEKLARYLAVGEMAGGGELAVEDLAGGKLARNKTKQNWLVENWLLKNWRSGNWLLEL